MESAAQPGLPATHRPSPARGFVVLALLVVATTAVIAVPYWTADYTSVRDDGLLGSFLEVELVLFLATFLAGAATQVPLWSVPAGMVWCAPVAVLGRVVIDTVADPTSHNLWPLELVISGAMAAPAVGLGVAVAWAVRILSRPPG